MKRERIKVGMKVRVSEDSDVIYKVIQIVGWTAWLYYEENGHVFSGGCADVSTLIKA